MSVQGTPGEKSQYQLATPVMDENTSSIHQKVKKMITHFKTLSEQPRSESSSKLPKKFKEQRVITNDAQPASLNIYLKNKNDEHEFYDSSTIEDHEPQETPKDSTQSSSRSYSQEKTSESEGDYQRSQENPEKILENLAKSHQAVKYFLNRRKVDKVHKLVYQNSKFEARKTRRGAENSSSKTEFSAYTKVIKTIKQAVDQNIYFFETFSMKTGITDILDQLLTSNWPLIDRISPQSGISFRKEIEQLKEFVKERQVSHLLANKVKILLNLLDDNGTNPAKLALSYPIYKIQTCELLQGSLDLLQSPHTPLEIKKGILKMVNCWLGHGLYRQDLKASENLLNEIIKLGKDIDPKVSFPPLNLIQKLSSPPIPGQVIQKIPAKIGNLLTKVYDQLINFSENSSTKIESFLLKNGISIDQLLSMSKEQRLQKYKKLNYLFIINHLTESFNVLFEKIYLSVDPLKLARGDNVDSFYHQIYDNIRQVLHNFLTPIDFSEKWEYLALITLKSFEKNPDLAQLLLNVLGETFQQHSIEQQASLADLMKELLHQSNFFKNKSHISSLKKLLSATDSIPSASDGRSLIKDNGGILELDLAIMQNYGGIFSNLAEYRQHLFATHEKTGTI